MSFRPFLDFYEKIEFAPTGTNDPEKRKQLFSLKNILYQNLGIPQSIIKNMDIIEIGPGSGENLVRLVEQQPKSITILDGSEKVLENIKNTVNFKKVKNRFILSDANIYSSENQYDLVVVEGVLPFQINPIDMFSNISKLVSKNGIMIVTTSCEFSIFSEICRRYVSKQIFNDFSYNNEGLKIIGNFFSEDFIYLPGMTRDPDHWILDSIFSPWGGDLFTLKDALEVGRRENLKFYSSSPKIFQDWRWYKDLDNLDKNELNNCEIHSYKTNSISFIDHRFVVDSLDLETYAQMSLLLKSFYYDVREYVINDRSYSNSDFYKFLIKLLSYSKHFHTETKNSILSLLMWSETGVKSDLKDFRKLWGRGQQFVSFLRQTNND